MDLKLAHKLSFRLAKQSKTATKCKIISEAVIFNVVTVFGRIRGSQIVPFGINSVLFQQLFQLLNRHLNDHLLMIVCVCDR